MDGSSVNGLSLKFRPAVVILCNLFLMRCFVFYHARSFLSIKIFNQLSHLLPDWLLSDIYKLKSSSFYWSNDYEESKELKAFDFLYSYLH